MMTNVIAKLKALGYNVVWAKHGEPYVPRGSSSSDEYQNYGIIVRW